MRRVVFVAALGVLMRRLPVLGALVLASCGRLGFETTGSLSGDGVLVDTDIDSTPDTDLLLWLPFDGTVTNRGVVTTEVACDSACPSTVAGKRSAAGGFDGATTAVRITDRPELHVTAGTFALWMRPTALPPPGEARSLGGVAYGTVSLNSWEIYLLGDLEGARLYAGGDVGNPAIDVRWTLGVGTWHHVASVWDGTSRQALYIDGLEVATGPQFLIVYDNHDVVFGADDTDAGVMAHFDGDLDDVRFYRRALTQGEIAQLAAP